MKNADRKIAELPANDGWEVGTIGSQRFTAGIQRWWILVPPNSDTIYSTYEFENESRRTRSHLS